MYNEETMDEIVELMQQKGFEQGRMMTRASAYNVVIGTEEDGDFWYGDIDFSNDNGTLSEIAKMINKTLLLRNEDIGLSMRIAAS